MKKSRFYILKWTDSDRHEQVFDLVDGYTEVIERRCFGVPCRLEVGVNRNEYGLWNATHLFSGLAICHGKRTRKEAIQFVYDNLNRVLEVEKLDRSVDCIKSLERFKRDGVCEQIKPFHEYPEARKYFRPKNRRVKNENRGI